MSLHSRRDHSEEPLWRRVDRATREINASLMVLAIGLALLYLTCAFGLLLKLS